MCSVFILLVYTSFLGGVFCFVFLIYFENTPGPSVPVGGVLREFLSFGLERAGATHAPIIVAVLIGWGADREMTGTGNTRGHWPLSRKCVLESTCFKVFIILRVRADCAYLGCGVVMWYCVVVLIKHSILAHTCVTAMSSNRHIAVIYL